MRRTWAVSVVCAFGALISSSALAAPGFQWRGFCFDTSLEAATAQCQDFGTLVDSAAAGPFLLQCTGAAVVAGSADLTIRRVAGYSGGPAATTYTAPGFVIGTCDTVTAASGFGVSGWLSALLGGVLLFVLMHGFSMGRQV